MAQKRAHSLSENDSETIEFLNKVKVEYNTISTTLKTKHPKIDIEEHKLYKFLTIFKAFIESNLDNLKKKILTLKMVLQTLLK